MKVPGHQPAKVEAELQKELHPPIETFLGGKGSAMKGGETYIGWVDSHSGNRFHSVLASAIDNEDLQNHQQHYYAIDW